VRREEERNGGRDTSGKFVNSLVELLTNGEVDEGSREVINRLVEF
jgi:hypothetical protein